MTIKRIIEKAITNRTRLFSHEYDFYGNLKRMVYEHKKLCHSKGEYARNEDEDGYCEVHVNSMEGVWSLLRRWLRPHRGISQEHLPFYIGFFEFAYNTRTRCKSLIRNMLQTFLSPPCKPYETSAIESRHTELTPGFSDLENQPGQAPRPAGQ